ncbi:MAG: PadR family transcriptional regulator [Acidimicrobiales bacterium]
MVKGHLELLLLGVLRRGPQHGYAIITDLREGSHGDFDLPEGTVSPALHKLERTGMVASDWSTVDGRKRRVYQLTPAGRAALAERRREWRRFVSGVEAVMGA